MPCYHPLKAFKVGVNPSGKPKYKICSYDVNYVYVKDDSCFCSDIRNSGPAYELVAHSRDC